MISVDDMRQEAEILNQALLEYGFCAYDGMEWMGEGSCFASWSLGHIEVTLGVELGERGLATVEVWSGGNVVDRFESDSPHFADEIIGSGLLDDWA